LHDAPPYYVLEEFPQDEEMWNSFQKIHYLVFLLLTRLATYKESDVSTLCPELMKLMQIEQLYPGKKFYTLRKFIYLE
jgi:hypothetical protein